MSMMWLRAWIGTHILRRRYRTKTGRELTDLDILALSAEAERGYDVAHLRENLDA